MKTYLAVLALAVLCALLQACGGGGSGADDVLEDFEPVGPGYVSLHDRLCPGLDHCSEECQQRLIAHDGVRCCTQVAQ